MATNPTPNPAPPPEERKSNLLWWFLGLIAAGLAVIGLGGLFVARYVLSNMQIQPSTRGVEISTPVGDLKVSKDGKDDPGLPVYPGAATSEAGATVEIAPASEDAVSITAARYRTVDALERVDTWYGEQLGPDFKREGPGVMVRKKDILGLEIKSSDVAYIAEDKSLLRVVKIEKKGNFTEIALARIGRQESQ